jgi:hypothetical protein
MKFDRADFAPGTSRQERPIFEDEALRVAMFQRWISLTFKGGGETPPTGNLLFGHNDRLEGTRSILFDEQYRGEKEFPGYRWGVRFDGNEAGLYDYGTNQLIAKYIFGITPSDDYLGSDGRAIHVKYLVDLSGGTAPSKNGHIILDN